MRDAQVTQIYEGPNQVQRVVMATASPGCGVMAAEVPRISTARSPGSGQTAPVVRHRHNARGGRSSLPRRASGDPPAASTTYALGRSPHFSSGIPTTATSNTAGCESRACSTSTVETFSPPEMMMSQQGHASVNVSRSLGRLRAGRSRSRP